MSLLVTVETSDTQLTTTAAVKEELGITTTSDDARLDRLITRASRWAERQVGYPLVARKYRETLAGMGVQTLMLSRTPIRALTGLFFGTDTGTATVLGSSEIDLEAGPGLISRPVGFQWSVPVVVELDLRPVPGQELRPWLADYVAGYAYGGVFTSSPLWSTEKGTTSTGRTLPEDIEDAVVQRAAALYSGTLAVTAKAVGDLRIQYGSETAGSVAIHLLRPYHRYL